MSDSGVALSLGGRWLAVAAGGTLAASRRLSRGRAGAGRLVDVLQLTPGLVSVRVPDGRGRSYHVEIEVSPLDRTAREEIVARCAPKVRHTAALLAGRLPGVLTDGDLLLPDAPPAATCTCRQPRPCRHEAAAHHAIATAIDRTPTRLLAIRGWSVQALLDALRSRRGGPAVQETGEQLDLSDPLRARGNFETIDVHPVPEADVRTIFDHLGPPPGFEDTEVLEALMSDAAALAWKLAAGEGAEAADDEALLTELRAQGVATASTIGSSLGLDDAVAQQALDRLYANGAVLRMGEGDAARYRAA